MNLKLTLSWAEITKYILQIEKATSGKITRERLLSFISDEGTDRSHPNCLMSLIDNNPITQDYLYEQIAIHKSTLNTLQAESQLTRIRLDMLEERLGLLLVIKKKVLVES